MTKEKQSTKELEDIKAMITLQRDVQYIKDKVDTIEHRIDQNYPTKDELLLLKQECFAKIDSLEPIRKGYYLIIGLILTAFFGALISLVIMKP